MTNLKNIIFDLDGTLLDTLGDLHTSTNYALHACGYPERSLDEVRRFVGNGVGLIHRAAPQGISETDFQHCFSIFKEHYAAHCLDTTRPYAGIMPLLKTLKGLGVRTAIVSNKMQQAVSELNDRFFPGLVDTAIGETPDVKRKPEPDMVWKAMRIIYGGEKASNTENYNFVGEAGISDCEKENTLYVGDSDVDILTARNAGLDCVSVLWGFRSKPFLIEHGAITLVSRPEEILSLL